MATCEGSGFERDGRFILVQLNDFIIAASCKLIASQPLRLVLCIACWVQQLRGVVYDAGRLYYYIVYHGGQIDAGPFVHRT